MRPRLLVACEYSGVVRDAFAARGWDAWSCDLEPTERPGQHYQGDVRDLLQPGRWDMMIAHPPCTHLAVSGARWFPAKRKEQADGLEFVRLLMSATVPHICIENPVSVISSTIRRADQIIQPWQFGHGETKATCLWLWWLPPLLPTNVVEGRENRVHAGCGFGWNTPECKRERSRTYQGIADAMAAQWGPVVETARAGEGEK